MAIKIKTVERKRFGGKNSSSKIKVVIKAKNNSKVVIGNKKQVAVSKTKTATVKKKK